MESCSKNIESGQGGNNALAQDGDNTSTQEISLEQRSDMSSQVLSSDDSILSRNNVKLNMQQNGGCSPCEFLSNLKDSTVIPVGTGPFGIELSPDCRTGYVINLSEGSVSVIDTSSNTVTSTITVGEEPFGIEISRDARTVYVVNIRDGTVSVIDTSSNTVIDTISVGNGPNDIVFKGQGNIAYVSNFEDDTVSVVVPQS